MVRRLDLYPTVTPEHPIEYNQSTRQWFVPFEAMVGKAVSERLHLGLGGAVKRGGGYEPYRYLVEARVEWQF